ncbi:MAG: c-type cytochrome domain-containing protein, partial [Planctomycetota bacterium]|nr:c-type cytochrome domain-containing protein [Planctomycetota bacterium]
MLARRTKRDRVLTTIMVIAGWSTAPAFLSAQEPTDLEVMFVHQVLPVLQEKCIACHGGKPEDIQGDLDLRSRQGLVAGGESEGPAWNASQPLESPLLKAVRWDGLEMPPKQNDRLTEMEV